MNTDTVDYRRRLIGMAAIAAVADAGFPAWAASSPGSTFPPLRQIEAGPLRIGYVDMGPADGAPVILLHGWPYDIHTFVEVAPLLVKAGRRVIIPYLRGYGATVFRSPSALRNGQQAAIALDVIALMDALKIPKAVLAGCDWGARAADGVAALWPERCTALVSVSGYLVFARQTKPAAPQPQAALAGWYAYYFATEQGRLGYEHYRHDFNKLIWKWASPQWRFDDATYERTAPAFDNPDHAAVVIHSYRWRMGLAEGEGMYDPYERKLAGLPSIVMPAITLEGDANGGPHGQPEGYRARFTGPYAHRPVSGGVGHNLPQEAPAAFAEAVLAVTGLA